MKLDDIRKSYIDFFVSKGHTTVRSSNLVPDNDPTLLFTNSGMVQFKDVFTGKEKRPYTRATSVQKCVRAGGKHNDLDNVGYTTRHHTFFEMLGNFSFGDYFKEEAITYSWEFISKVLKLEKDKLYFTVYPEDIEARNLWKKIASVGDSRILDVKDNIWSMGDVGPCGFCTEIFYDKGLSVKGGLPGTPDEDGDRYMEIWNNVFMQFETLPDGSQIDLINKNIDTGMSLERLASVLQGVTDNYDIDLFKGLITNIEDILSVKRTDDNSASFKVIADHIRTTGFLIAEGVMPSNEGRGYVLRRIMRRALRHINLLGVKTPSFYKMFEDVKNQMGDTYPELKENEAFIKNTIQAEEESFGATLESGLKILEEEVGRTSGNILNGDSAFKLYDTYGFPLDLTSDILRNRNMTVDEEGFNKAMLKQRENSKKSSNFKGEAGTSKVLYDVAEKNGATEFVGYGCVTYDSTVKSVIKNSEIVESGMIETDEDEVFIIVDKTPFYAECGGQISDSGNIELGDKSFNVSDVKKALNNIYLHKIDLDKGIKISAGDKIKMTVNAEKRKLIVANHSAAHLLQKALKTVVGNHVSQKGSWVGDTGFRFDFTNPKGLTSEQIVEVEHLVNSYIEDNLCICTKEIPLEEAKASGAVALFGEKYSDIVRVVNMGETSIELCGGTHCTNTSEIKLFKIVREESIASGIRRIEAITSNEVLNLVDKYGIDKTLAATLIIKELNKHLRQTQESEQDKLAAEFEEKKRQEAEEQNKQIETGINNISNKQIGNINFVSAIYSDISAKNLKPIADKLKDTNPKNTLMAFISTMDDKVSILISISNDLIGKLSAVDMVKSASITLGGRGGGGRADLAQAGGIDATKTGQVIDEIKEIIKKL